MTTETQAECHKRLKCKPNEELEDCKKRLRAAQKDGGAGEPDDADRKGGEGRDREDADKDKKDREGDRDDDKKGRKDRDRDNEDKKGRDRDRDKDKDKDKDKDRGGRQRDRQGGNVDNDKGRPRDRQRDDEGDHGGGGGDGGGGGHGILRRGTHPGFFSGGIGPSWGVCAHGHCEPSNVDYAAFYGTLDFGWHFSGNFDGPAIGANIHAGYGSFGPFNDSRLGAGFKFWWDIPMAHDLGFYFTPFAQAGWSSFIFEDRPFGCNPRFFDCNHNWEHFFNLQFGAMLRLILGDRGLLYFQPMTFDNVINGNGYGLLYHFEIGGGVTFGN